MVDLRSQSELDRVSQAMFNLQPVPGRGAIEVKQRNRPPLEHHITRGLFAQACEIGRGFGLDLQEGGTGGGSDGNLTGASPRWMGWFPCLARARRPRTHRSRPDRGSLRC
ncbi:MAG: hypothetical protein R2856_22095 [Caldilineaceae bacterium]